MTAVSSRSAGWRRLVGVLLVAHAASVGAVQVTDDRGIARQFLQSPRRIVSLVPSVTETVCALGACDRLVGVDDFSNHPLQVRSLPHVGGLDDASIERIVALKPDLVLAAPSARAVARLESLGLTVLVLYPERMADVWRVFDTLERVLATQRAGVLWQRMQAEVGDAARTVSATSRGLRVYVEVNDGPYAASESSFIGELLAPLGAANIVPASLGTFPKLNPEFVVRADPQVIIVSAREVQALRARPGWQRISALRNGQVCAFDTVEGDVLARPGPRMAQAARWLAQCLGGTR